MRNRVGLGTFPLAGVFNPISRVEAEKVVKKFLDLGGYYIDTAPLYGNGSVEKLLGNVLKSVPRKDYYLITKTVKHVDEFGKPFISGKYDDVIRQINNCLDRLQTNYIDLLMIHSPDSSVPIDETLRAMEKLQRDGKVKELAVSNVNLSELQTYNQSGKIRYVQNKFSLINRSISDDFRKYLLDNEIFLIPWHLLETGLLTGKAFENFTMRKGDFRENFYYLNKINQEEIFSWVRNYLAPIAKKLDITIGQLNLAWGLHQPYIDFIIAGTTNPENLAINLQADKIKLSTDIIKELETAYRNFEDQIRKKYGKSIKDFRRLNEKFY